MWWRQATPLWGLSPRVRGKLVAFVTGKMRKWSIPACAGEASNSAWLAAASRVYPRVCGGSASRHCVGVS